MVAPHNSQSNQRKPESQSNAPAPQPWYASLSENLVKNSGRSIAVKELFQLWPRYALNEGLSSSKAAGKR